MLGCRPPTCWKRKRNSRLPRTLLGRNDRLVLYGSIDVVELDVAADNSLASQLQYFISCIMEHKSPVTNPPEESLQVMEVMAALKQSADTRRVIVLTDTGAPNPSYPGPDQSTTKGGSDETGKRYIKYAFHLRRGKLYSVSGPGDLRKSMSY